MEFGSWLAFAAASVVLLAIPGPTIVMVIGRAMAGARGGAVPLVAGVAAGDLTAMTLSLAGLGALLAASSVLFTALKWLGAAYLIWLGIRLWRAPVAAGADGLTLPGGWRAARDMFVVTALNPKSIAFFVAFVPQFIDATREFMPQAAIMIATFVLLGALNAAVYAALAHRLSARIRRPEIRRWFNRAGGSLLIGAGVATAAMRRA